MSDDVANAIQVPFSPVSYQKPLDYANPYSAPYRDIFGYTPQGTTYMDPTVTGGDDPNRAGTLGYPSTPLGFSGSWDANQQWSPIDKYKGIVSYNTGIGGGDDPKANPYLEIDYSKLPKVGAFGGNPGSLMPVDPSGDMSGLVNPQMIYNDPNYGWVTPQSNQKTSLGEKITNYAPAAIMAGATAGFGSLVGPAIAPFLKGGIGAAQGMLAGGSPVGAIAGAAGSYLGGLTGIPGGSTIGNMLGKYGASYLPQIGASSGSGVASNVGTNFQGNSTMDNPVYPNGVNLGNINVTPNYDWQTAFESGYPENSQGQGNQPGYFDNGTNWPPGTSSSSGGGFNPLTAVGGLINGITGNSNNLFNTGAAAASAYQDWMNSQKYMDLATKYADQMDPFGKQRAYYQDQLKSSYTDPTAFLNDPAHLAIQERQMAALGAKLGAGGYMGSGLEKTQLADYLATSDNQFLGQERDRLGGYAGSNIGPAAAAGLISQGIQGSVNAQNNATANLTRALNPNGGSPSTSTAPGGSGLPTGSSQNPINAVQRPTLGGGANQMPLGSTVTGALDQWGNKVVTGAAGQIVGIVGKDGSFYNNVPTNDYGGSSGGQEGQTGVLDPSTGYPWGQTSENPDIYDPGIISSNGDWTSGYDLTDWVTDNGGFGDGLAWLFDK